MPPPLYHVPYVLCYILIYSIFPCPSYQASITLFRHIIMSMLSTLHFLRYIYYTYVSCTYTYTKWIVFLFSHYFILNYFVCLDIVLLFVHLFIYCCNLCIFPICMNLSPYVLNLYLFLIWIFMTYTLIWKSVSQMK